MKFHSVKISTKSFQENNFHYLSGFSNIFFCDRRVVFSAEKHLRTINCCERLNYFRLTEDEASTLIQAWWRGVKTRRRPEIRELIEYQKELRHKKSS